MDELVFLKLGGSLITDKTRPYTARLDKLADLAAQIASVLDSTPGLRLILGHGSGSFGHTAAREYGTRAGLPVQRREDKYSPSPLIHLLDGEGRYWKGFAEVWYQASELNRYVMQALHEANVPAIALAPVASVTAQDGKVSAWDLGPLHTALGAGLVPVIYGDVIFDTARGGTILSTEELMLYLALELHPQRILLAGLEEGVWEDYPARTRLFSEIRPGVRDAIRKAAGAANGADVTGGMSSKVEEMLQLVQEINGLQVRIFSGEGPNNLGRALHGDPLGTLIRADD